MRTTTWWVAVGALCATTMASSAQAVALQGDGSWASFAVDEVLADPARPFGWIDDTGASLSFTFRVAAGTTATLTVVDAAFAGDTFSVFNGSTLLGTTSSVPLGTMESSPNVGFDYASALANPLFSRGVFTLGSGDYAIGGRLDQSVVAGGFPLNATAGAVRLVVSPVPEPETTALIGAGLATVGWVARRRRRLQN